MKRRRRKKGWEGLHAKLGGEAPTAEDLERLLGGLAAKGLIEIFDGTAGPSIRPILGVRDFLRIVTDLGTLVMDGEVGPLQLTRKADGDLADLMVETGFSVSDVLKMILDHALLFPDGGPNYPGPATVN